MNIWIVCAIPLAACVAPATSLPSSQPDISSPSSYNYTAPKDKIDHKLDKLDQNLNYMRDYISK